MEISNIKCECNRYFDENEFQSHYRLCPAFKNVYKDFDLKISELLKSFSEPKERLLAIYFLFNKYTEKIRKKIKDIYKIIHYIIMKAFFVNFVKSVKLILK